MSKTTDDIRRAFLDYFAAKGHQVVASGPLVPPNDPTLMFANAGMVQFKDVFTGREKRDYVRATSSQKCIRISGKHNDLEAVGPSPRHHTFFEMLGNFSFGDYFKEEAIVYAWDFLTKTLDIPTDRLVCTYFGGEDGIEADETARELWKKVTGFGDDRILGLGMSENFWQMGDTGPCGPSSEIHIFNGGKPDFSTFGAEQTSEGRGWMELWNLVFMQFERSKTDSGYELSPLPAPSIDTGAGLERLACVQQGKMSNYDIDAIRAIVDWASEVSGKKYGGTMEPHDVSMRVIADHSRLTAFLIAEGVLPDRAGRAYVLRRVMRRAIRHGHRLGIDRPFLHEAALRVIDIMSPQYPELSERRDLIATVAEQEEVRFRQTIERGLSLLEERFTALEKTGRTELGGDDTFKLYDTYGFPPDLTEVISRERGIAVDMAGYERAMADARARSDFKGMGQAVEAVYRQALERLDGDVEFTGYERETDTSQVVAVLLEGAIAERAAEGDAVEIVVGKTPFYGEAGGQVGDQGTITTETGIVTVHDTMRPVAGLVVHRGTVERGSVAPGQPAKLAIDALRRNAIRKNHSATHLLHLALRSVVGGHAQQKGSLVAPDKLRFDYTHGKALTRDQIGEIERIVNERIIDNHAITTDVLSMDEAKSRGAMMIFEEKYGDVVRMLTIADSVELCGGTHARATGDIGLFKVVGDESIAAGVRRITATTGMASLGYVRELEARLGEAARAAKAAPAELAAKVEKIVARERKLERQIGELQKKLAQGGGGGGIEGMLSSAREVGGVKVLGVRSDVTDRGALRELAEQLRDKLGDSVVLVGSEADGKAQLVLVVAKSLTERYKAGALIKPIAEIVGGSGGGRPDMAQAGGTNPKKLDDAIAAVYDGVA